MDNRSTRTATIGIPQSTLPEGAPISGHSRVWTSVRDALAQLAVLDASGTPDVWFFSAHGGLPEVTGRLVAVAYEAGWTVEGAYVGYPKSYLDAIDSATREGVTGADAVIVGAESAKRELINAYGLAPESIHVIPFGVDLTSFHPDRRHEAQQLPALQHLGPDPFVAFVNSLAPRKNVGLVRDALQQLIAEGYPHRLVMVASAAKHLGGDVEAIERAAFAEFEAGDNRVVRLKGLSDAELAGVLATASVLCAPSSHEGFGLTVLEAMASGTPVVASTRGALPEVVGAGGLCVEPELSEVVAALKTILDGDEPTWRSRARTQAEQFPWQRTASGWSAVATLVATPAVKSRRLFSRKK